VSVTLPGPTVGVVGGGQLGRMLAEAAAPLGVEVVVLDPTPSCPASLVARDQVVADFDDEEAIADLAARCDALTYEIELADPDALAAAGEGAGVPVHPSPATLRTIQDKLVQNRALADAGVPLPAFRPVEDAADLRAAVEEYGGVMLKARTGGYDGRGNLPVTDPDDAADALESLGGAALAEDLVDFDRELSVIAVRGDDERRTYDAGENVHEAEILRETVVPARTDEAVLARAREVAADVLDVLSGRGVFGVELFEADGEILVNEVAPRPHNSGHWTIEGAVASQFEQHARAVLGWPLGSTERTGDAVVSANVLGDVDDPTPATLRGVEDALATPGLALHWYGKREARPLRKMGHLTAVSDRFGDERDRPADRDALLDAVRARRDRLTFRQ
jgi:5-(carboxyamino)imidazole ribonucleotide synthase